MNKRFFLLPVIIVASSSCIISDNTSKPPIIASDKATYSIYSGLIHKLFRKNIGTTIFKPIINPTNKQSELDQDNPIRWGFYFEKRNKFEPGEYALTIQEDYHITLGLIIGESPASPSNQPETKGKITRPLKKYIVIVDKQGTLQEFPAIKLGKILSEAQRWLTNLFIISK